MFSVLIALGSNLGDRLYHLSRALEELGRVMRVVRISSVHETEPLDAPVGSPPFYNVVIAGYTKLGPHELLDALMAIEKRLGRVRRGRNAPRTIDLDLILHSAHVARTPELTIPHPRYLDRDFVRKPLGDLKLGWVDPLARVRI